MSGIKPEQFDYNAAVDRYNAEGFDWAALAQSTEDPGFAELTQEQRQHVWDLLQVASGKKHGIKVEPHAATGEQSAFRQFANLLKQMVVGGTPDMGATTRPGLAEATTYTDKAVTDNTDLAIAAYVQAGASRDQALKARKADMERAGGKIVQQFGYYFSGGAIPEPAESADPYVKNMMDQVIKPATAITAVVGQVVTGNFLLGLVSKVPLISSAAENLSSFTRGMIKTGILDFGINAAWPEGLSVENRIGISDNISRWLAPENVIKNPKSPLGRMYAGVGGMLEGGLLGSVLTGFSTGVKLADSKYAFSVGPEMLERVKQSLEAAGVDVAGMTRRDIVSTYKTRLSELVQGRDEAIFNGQRSSAEEWIAQAFLHDPNITELTPAEGRLLYGIFSNNKGGISVINSITDPEAAIRKLRQVGINVDATVLPRRSPGMGATNADIPVPAPTVSDAELDAAVELTPHEALRTQAEALSSEVSKRENAGETGPAMQELVMQRDEAWARANFSGSDKARVEEIASLSRKMEELKAAYGESDPTVQRLQKLIVEGSKPNETVVAVDPEVGAKSAQTARDTREAALSVEETLQVIRQRFPDLDPKKQMALADGLNKNEAWAISKFKEMLAADRPPVEKTTGEKIHEALIAGSEEFPSMTSADEMVRHVKETMTPREAVDALVGKATAPEPVPTSKRKRPTKAEVKAANDRAMKAERRATDAEREAQTDGLTGLHNQKSWKATQARVDADPNLEVVSMDLSDFKALNDEIGHEAGDLALQRAAQAIQEANKVIGGEQAFRLGGDEFVMVVPKGKGQQALELAQKLFAPRITELIKDAGIGTKLRGAVGNTYAEADAAERTLRATEKGFLSPMDEQLAALKKRVGTEGVPNKTVPLTTLDTGTLNRLMLNHVYPEGLGKGLQYALAQDGELVYFTPNEVYTELKRRYVQIQDELKQTEFLLQGNEGLINDLKARKIKKPTDAQTELYRMYYRIAPLNSELAQVKNMIETIAGDVTRANRPRPQ